MQTDETVRQGRQQGVLCNKNTHKQPPHFPLEVENALRTIPTFHGEGRKVLFRARPRLLFCVEGLGELSSGQALRGSSSADDELLGAESKTSERVQSRFPFWLRQGKRRMNLFPVPGMCHQSRLNVQMLGGTNQKCVWEPTEHMARPSLPLHLLSSLVFLHFTFQPSQS